MILTLTLAPGIDLVYDVDGGLTDGVAPRARVLARQRRWYAAGKGINVARGLRDLGQDVVALALGGGVGALLLEELMRREGLAGEVIESSTDVRINVTVGSQEGELHVVQPSGSPTARDLEAFHERVVQRIESCDVLVISGHCPPPLGGAFVMRVLDLARDCQVRTIVDTRDEALRAVAEGGRPWLLKPNLEELSQLAGRSLAREGEVLEAARRARAASGATHVLVSLGPGGALLVGPDGTWRAEAPGVPVVNTVGAGDAMVAAVACAPRGMEPSDLLRRAVAAGCANVGEAAPGAVPAEAFARLLREIEALRMA